MPHEPSDLAARQLPIRAWVNPLVRVRRISDDPRKMFGVIYGSEELEGAYGHQLLPADDD